ncbi:cytochrome b domain-containing protein [Janthinobacterium sp. HH01]|uniref:cytochrome b/b6 domain-containing protein n=1 Tax=Janthinobacterium sp. HH01 TaxID=1198452 RepID=UPI0002AED04A|nr:cytochrome b/b6 domain-containing protein [Janthinobacterium sp. HH01]ELX13168.1 cytochrome b domain-containing protein [Janthinobacterium sp. HH01]
MNQRATYEELQPAAAAAPTRRRILVWDLPTRVFHWSLVLAVTVAIVSGEVGGDWMEVHGKAGLAILGLVVFRLAWGFAGSTHARFLSFLPTAASLRAYLRGRWKGQGHNPLGALSVFALLGLLAVQATTGLFGNDEISFTGPLFALVEEGLANRLTGLHKQLAYVLLAVLALHIVAILVYLFLKKDNLVKPMVTGWKEVRAGTSAAKGSWTALLLSIAFAGAVVASASGAVRW